MQLRPRSPRVVSILACTLALGACVGSKQADSSEPSPENREGEATTSEPTSDGVVEAATAGKELPAELVAELRRQGDDVDGRLVTLATGFMATAACSDCGAPSYLWFMAVRCADTHHCKVLTEQCEGEIRREAETFVLEFRPVAGGTAQVCDGYSGTFVLP
jgi:hypothetical protein